MRGYLYNGLFSKCNDERCAAFQSMAWFFIVHKNAIRNCSTAPQGLSLCKLYFVFHKSKDTSPIPQPNVQHLVYVFPIFFCYHKCFDNFHLSKYMLIKKFFHWNMFSSWFDFYDTRRLSVSPWSKIISCD